MRGLVTALISFGAVSSAFAADMPDFLRGSFPAAQAPTRNWEGWYAGGQADYSSTNMDFSQSLTGLTNNIYRNTVLESPTSTLSTLGTANPHSPGFGGFVGRNWQWDDVVLGVEANYNYYNNLVGSSTSSIGPLEISFPAGQSTPANDQPSYAVTLKGNAQAAIQDAITLRGRAGWAIGDFLPYAFGGLAVGRMDIQRNVSSTTSRSDTITTTTTNFGVTTTTTTTTPFTKIASLSTTASQERTNDFVVGWTGGLGFEYAFWNNVFLRGEWEYLKFVSVMNTSITMNSARVGLGYKF